MKKFNMCVQGSRVALCGHCPNPNFTLIFFIYLSRPMLTSMQLCIVLFLFGLILYVSVNSDGHVETVS